MPRFSPDDIPAAARFIADSAARAREAEAVYVSVNGRELEMPELIRNGLLELLRAAGVEHAESINIELR